MTKSTTHIQLAHLSQHAAKFWMFCKFRLKIGNIS